MQIASMQIACIQIKSKLTGYAACLTFLILVGFDN